MKKYLLGAMLIASCVFAYAQVGVGTNNPKATLDVNAMYKTGNESLVDGVLIPRVDRERALSMTNVVESTLIYVDNVSNGPSNDMINAVGFYYYKSNEQGGWVKLGSEYAKPEFFYMPSVILPTYPTDGLIINDNQAYKETAGLFEVDLFLLFSRQFVNPLASSPEKISSISNTIKSQKDKLDQFIKTASDYHYYIVYADQTLFDDIKVDTNGKLSYKIKSDAVIKNGSFMNAVLKVK